jgi:hypothetical protein
VQDVPGEDALTVKRVLGPQDDPVALDEEPLHDHALRVGEAHGDDLPNQILHDVRHQVDGHKRAIGHQGFHRTTPHPQGSHPSRNAQVHALELHEGV